ncbi:MAG: hypothetical protein RR254_00975 [Muribaculaceae bacterium]
MRSKLIYVFMVVCLLFSCDKKGSDIHDSFSLSKSKIEIKVGEKYIINVISAKKYTFTIDDNVAIATRNRNNEIHIIGIAEGETKLVVISDNEKQECNVKVVSEPIDEDLQKELGNKSLRITGAGINMNYNTAGTLFSKNKKNNVTTYLVAEFDTNNYVSIAILGDIPQNDGELELTAFRSTLIAGTSKISSVKILKQEAGIIWLKIYFDNKSSLLCVLEK